MSVPPVAECWVWVVRSPRGLNAQLVQYAPPVMPSPTVEPLLLAGLAAQLSVAVQAWASRSRVS